MFCPYCGQPISPTATICPHCNAQIPDIVRSTYGAAPVAAGAPTAAAPVDNSRRRITIIAVSVVVLVLALITCAVVALGGSDGPILEGGTGPAASGASGSEHLHKSTKDVSDRKFQVDLDLNELALGSLDTAGALDDFQEFKLRGMTAYTKDSHMVELVRYDDYDIEIDHETAESYREEMKTVPIWYLELYSDNEEYVGFDAIRNGTDIKSVTFEGNYQGDVLTCDDVAEIVSEHYGYDGMVLYKQAKGEGWYSISGYMVNEKTAATLWGYSSYYESDNAYSNSITINTMPIDTNDMRNMKAYAFLFSNQDLLKGCDDTLFVDVSSPSLRKLIDENYDQKAFEEKLRASSKSIGSTFETPFDLSELVVSSPEACASMLEPLFESKQGYYTNDIQQYYYHFSENKDMAAAMGLDIDGDGKGDKLEGTISTAPWYFSIENKDYKDISRDKVRSEEQIYFVRFWGHASTNARTCKEFADLIKPIYNYEKILLHADPYTGEISGLAIQGDSIIQITGYPEDDIMPSGTCSVSINVYNVNDNGSGKYYKEDFDEQYRDEGLKDSYAEVYFE